MPRIEPRLSKSPAIRWHVHVNGQTYGPYTEQEIQQMIERQQIVSSDLVYAQGGVAWQRVTSDPVLGALFKRSAPQPPRRQQRKATPLPWLLGVLFVAILGWFAWPYYALYDLAVGANTGDVSILEGRVDWTTLREGLRGDLNALFLQSMKAQAHNQKNDSGAALGQGLAVMLGPVIIDRMVDAYVTPQAIAAQIQSEKATNVPPVNAAQSAPSAQTTVPVSNANGLAEPVQRIRQSKIQYAFFSGSPFVFLVQVKPNNDEGSQQPIGLRFQWEGTWKLARIVLPPDLISGVAAAAKADSAKNQAR